METILDKNSPQLEKIKTELNNLREKINNLKTKGRKTGVILGLKNLPELTLNYYRYFRDVEVNNAILEYVIPLYEQAKLEEQKDIPVLRVIDYAVPPAKKSYPPRLIFTLLITSVMITLLIIYFLIAANIKHKNYDKIILLKRELMKW